jgi:hypothetical protein
VRKARETKEGEYALSRFEPLLYDIVEELATNRWGGGAGATCATCATRWSCPKRGGAQGRGARVAECPSTPPASSAAGLPG